MLQSNSIVEARHRERADPEKASLVFAAPVSTNDAQMAFLYSSRLDVSHTPWVTASEHTTEEEGYKMSRQQSDCETNDEWPKGALDGRVATHD